MGDRGDNFGAGQVQLRLQGEGVFGVFVPQRFKVALQRGGIGRLAQLDPAEQAGQLVLQLAEFDGQDFMCHNSNSFHAPIVKHAGGKGHAQNGARV